MPGNVNMLRGTLAYRERASLMGSRLISCRPLGDGQEVGAAAEDCRLRFEHSGHAQQCGTPVDVRHSLRHIRQNPTRTFQAEHPAQGQARSQDLVRQLLGTVKVGRREVIQPVREQDCGAGRSADRAPRSPRTEDLAADRARGRPVPTPIGRWPRRTASRLASGRGPLRAATAPDPPGRSGDTADLEGGPRRRSHQAFPTRGRRRLGRSTTAARSRHCAAALPLRAGAPRRGGAPSTRPRRATAHRLRPLHQRPGRFPAVAAQSVGSTRGVRASSSWNGPCSSRASSGARS